MNIGHLTIERDNSAGLSRVTFLIHNTLNGRFVRMGASETRYLLESIKVADATAGLGVSDSPELADDLKKALKNKFDEWGFLSSGSGQQKIKSNETVKKLVLCRFNVEKMLKVIYPVYSKFFSPAGLTALIFLAVFDIGCIAYTLANAGYSAVLNAAQMNIIFGPQDIFTVLGFVIVMTFFHEFAHAVNCKKYGGEVKNMGILLYYCIPCFFCDVSSVYTFKDKRHRMMVAGAGVLANFFIGLLLIFISLILAFNGTVIMGLVYSGLAGICIGIYNLIPFVKLDGYWLLSSACQVVNLMEKAIITAYTAIFRHDRLADIKMSPGKKILMTIYGIAAFIFSEVFWISTLFSLRNLFAAWAFIYYPAAALIIVMITLDLIKTVRHYHELVKNDYDRLIRLI